LTDQKPPRRIGDDRTTLTSLLRYQRESVARKLEGLSEADGRRSPVPSGTSLLWLVKHLTRAEALWVLHRFAGQPLEVDDTVTDDDSVAGVLAGYRAMWARVDVVVAAASMDDPCVASDTAEIPDLRWVLAHLLQETARHAGHADILRELIDGETGR
jgi:hypothetical protein